MRFHLGTIGLGTIIIVVIVLAKLVGAQTAQTPKASPATAALRPSPTSSTGAAVPPPAPTLPAPAPLTDSERINLRTSQVALLKAQQARVCASIADLAQTPEWQAAQAADGEFRSAIRAIFVARKIDEADYQICDGPGQGNSVCAGLAKDTLELRAIPKAVTK